MKPFNLKQLFAFLALAFALLLQGCATVPSGAFLHGIGYCNAGDKTITFFKIQYGDVVRANVNSNFKGGMDKNCINSYGYTATMPVPKIMVVEWQTDDGSRHIVEIPVQALITNNHPITNIKVRFNDEKLQILQINVNGLQPYLNAKTVIFEQ